MDAAPDTPHVDAETFGTRTHERGRADRLSGVIIALIMLAALGVMGRRIWAIASGPPPPGPGSHAPHFTAPTPAGAELGLGRAHGDVVLVDFWATWCPPCRAAMPGLQAVHEDYRDRGFKVLGVNQEPGEAAKVQRFMQGNGYTFPTVLDPGGISRAWGVYTFPTSFLVGRDGVIREVYRGPASERRLREDIEAALTAADPG